METLDKSDGFSARRRTIKNQINPRFCTRPLAVLTVLGLLICSCKQNTKGQSKIAKSPTHLEAYDSIKPKVSINVNRHFDKEGNVIGFDSTYSSYYSNITGDTSSMDSIMHNFDTFFNLNHPSFFNKHFSPLFFNDTSRYPDFFHDDFFRKRYELNDKYMRSMMDRMDSIKNQFYKNENTNKKRSKTL